MNIKNIFFFIIIFLFNSKLLSQSFEKQYQIDSLINVNLKSNENIAYINNEGSIIFFNSSFTFFVSIGNLSNLDIDLQ